MLNATCNAHVVTVEGKAVTATVLSQGTLPSEGVLLLEKENAKYLTSNATDISAMIQTMCTILDQLILISTGLDAVSTTPGSQAANITALGLLKTAFLATKDTLK